MVVNHNFKQYPELRNSQMAELEFVSPHPQIKEDFWASVEKVTDGDTVLVSTSFRDFNFPIRILDIDAPEMSEGGEKTKSWLKNRIEGNKVMVLIDPENRVGKYGRLLGTVLHNGISVGEEMIHLGLAVPFGSKNEGQPTNLNKLLRLNQWV